MSGVIGVLQRSLVGSCLLRGPVGDLARRHCHSRGGSHSHPEVKTLRSPPDARAPPSDGVPMPSSIPECTDSLHARTLAHVAGVMAGAASALDWRWPPILRRRASDVEDQRDPTPAVVGAGAHPIRIHAGEESRMDDVATPSRNRSLRRGRVLVPERLFPAQVVLHVGKVPVGPIRHDVSGRRHHAR